MSWGWVGRMVLIHLMPELIDYAAVAMKELAREYGNDFNTDDAKKIEKEKEVLVNRMKANVRKGSRKPT